jgi:hypothetical protein
VRKTLMALAAAIGLLGVGTVSASAITLTPPNGPHPAQTEAAPAIQQADWYCGPRCEYRHHRQWQERRWEEGQRWRDYNRGYNHYGYNGNGYGYNGGYGYRYR